MKNCHNHIKDVAILSQRLFLLFYATIIGLSIKDNLKRGHKKWHEEKKNQTDILDIFIGVTSLLVTLITLMMNLFIKLICFIYDVITIYQSGYKKKSGNGFFKTYFNKGHMGEFRLYRKLKRLMKAEDTIYTNIYLPGLNTTHTELDLLVVSKKGLIVYEVKNYGGYIYGSKRHWKWRMIQFKEKRTSQTEGVRTSLLTYPALMAADILLYDASISLEEAKLTLLQELYLIIWRHWFLQLKWAKIKDLQEPKKMISLKASQKSYILLEDNLN